VARRLPSARFFFASLLAPSVRLARQRGLVAAGAARREHAPALVHQLLHFSTSCAAAPHSHTMPMENAAHVTFSFSAPRMHTSTRQHVCAHQHGTHTHAHPAVEVDEAQLAAEDPNPCEHVDKTCGGAMQTVS
jgi:hypothetical protein